MAFLEYLSHGCNGATEKNCRKPQSGQLVLQSRLEWLYSEYMSDTFDMTLVIATKTDQSSLLKA
jgi:hypothetical protein